jgi:hypothetical protein
VKPTPKTCSARPPSTRSATTMPAPTSPGRWKGAKPSAAVSRPPSSATTWASWSTPIRTATAPKPLST